VPVAPDDIPRMSVTIVPKRWFSWNFSVISGGRTLAALDLSAWRESAEIRIGDVTHHVFRERAMGGDFVIEAGGRQLARAAKPSAFRNTLVVYYDGREYTLRKASVWRRDFELMHGARRIGTLAPESWRTRRATADLPSDWPAPITAFVIWLVIIMWKREATAAAV
jgi:hypothetical protein